VRESGGIAADPVARATAESGAFFKGTATDRLPSFAENLHALATSSAWCSEAPEAVVPCSEFARMPTFVCLNRLAVSP